MDQIPQSIINSLLGGALAALGWFARQLWDAIKEVGGANPADIVADIQVSNPSVFAKHTVEKGESLSKIAKHYYDDMMKYKAIFEANRDILDNPDVIHPGQVLTIPTI